MTQNCILRVTLPSVFVNFCQKPPKTVDFSQWCITYAVARCCSQQQGWVSSGFAAVAVYGITKQNAESHIPIVLFVAPPALPWPPRNTVESGIFLSKNTDGIPGNIGLDPYSAPYSHR